MTSCEVVRAFGQYRVGDIIEPTGVYRDHLCRLGLIRKMEDADGEPVIERATLSPAITATIPRKRGRPRKAS